MSDAVKIISDYPRRLEELLDLLEDRNRHTRDRAAATMAQVASIHPNRLLRSAPRLREILLDESAYVRWHIVHTLGILVARFPSRLQGIVHDLQGCLEDQNGIVRALAAKALARIAVSDPQLIGTAFRGIEKALPPIVADVLKKNQTTNLERE